MISKELLEILACPVCKENPVPDRSCKYLVCHKCELKYPYRNDIAIMLLEDAEHAKKSGQ